MLQPLSLAMGLGDTWPVLGNVSIYFGTPCTILVIYPSICVVFIFCQENTRMWNIFIADSAQTGVCLTRIDIFSTFCLVGCPTIRFIVFWISVFLLNMIMFFNILITLRTGKKEIQKALSVLSVASSGICLTISIEPWKFFGAFQKFHQQWGLFNQHVRLWTGLKELKKEVCWAIEQYFGPN